MKSYSQDIIRKKLFEIKDDGYAAFQAKLTPTVDPSLFIGCRVPQLRLIAKSVYKEGGYEDFLEKLPHEYYDENLLHGLIISEYKDYEECLMRLDLFLPFVDNWAVCDTMNPKSFKKHKEDLIDKIRIWVKSDDTYTCRFGMNMLMKHYLDEAFKEEYLLIPASVKSEEYYVNMMIAWFFATALSKQWESAVSYIEKKKLSPWVHNKTIQKAVESYRITSEEKDYLKSLRIK